MSKAPKIENLISLVQRSLSNGDYVFTGHANQRLQHREVTRLEVKQVLKSGFHEKRKDKYDDTYGSWNYSISGKTLDMRALRIVISFDEDGMLIVTVIDISK
jgi:hypothetical protein